MLRVPIMTIQTHHDYLTHWEKRYQQVCREINDSISRARPIPESLWVLCDVIHARHRELCLQWAQRENRNEAEAVVRGWTKCVCGDPECGVWFAPGSDEPHLGVPTFFPS